MPVFQSTPTPNQFDAYVKHGEKEKDDGKIDEAKMKKRLRAGTKLLMKQLGIAETEIDDAVIDNLDARGFKEAAKTLRKLEIKEK